MAQRAGHAGQRLGMSRPALLRVCEFEPGLVLLLRAALLESVCASGGFVKECRSSKKLGETICDHSVEWQAFLSGIFHLDKSEFRATLIHPPEVDFDKRIGRGGGVGVR